MFQVGELAWHKLFLRRRRHLAPMAFFLIAGIMSFVFFQLLFGFNTVVVVVVVVGLVVVLLLSLLLLVSIDSSFSLL